MSPSAEAPRERVIVGRIGRAHGIHGDVAIAVRTDEPELRFAVGASLLAGPPGDRMLWVRQIRWHSGRLLCSFADVGDRTAAAQLTGSILEAEIDVAQRPSEPDEFYDRHLVGLRALRENGHELGTIQQVMHLPGHDVLSIATPDGMELLVPFVSQLVPDVDLDTGVVIVRPPKGLFDSNVDSNVPNEVQ